MHDVELIHYPYAKRKPRKMENKVRIKTNICTRKENILMTTAERRFLEEQKIGKFHYIIFFCHVEVFDLTK